MSEETREQLAQLLIVLAIGDVLITAFLIQKAREVREAALTERAGTSLTATLAASCLAILSAAFLVGFVLPPALVTVLFIAPFVLLSIPNYVWAIAYVLRLFR